jgi:pilus assembly protein CpaF
MCTIHANSAREAVTKLCTLPLLAGENVSHSFVVPTVAGCIDLVVHVSMEANGRRVVREILAIRGGRLVRADGWPPHLERFERAGFDIVALLSEAH